MLHLSTLTLSHFRSHLRTRLAFDGRPVVLQGANGAGKTNVLEAVSLFSPGRGLRRAGAEELSRRPECVGWKLRATLSTLTELETYAEPGQTRQVVIDGKPAPQIALARYMAVLWLTPVMDRLWLEGAEGRRRTLDRLALSFAPDHAALALAYDKAMRDRNRLLRDGVQDIRWFGALEAQMAQAGVQITANRLHALDQIAAHADPDSPFPMADLSLDCDAPRDPETLAEALAAHRPRDMAAGRSLIGPHRADLRALWTAKGMEAAQCSTGEQKAFLISLILANARALAALHGTPPILLLDEVAAHLDAARRAALYDAICGLGAQAFLTGTGPELFTDFGPRAQHYLVTDAGAGSQITETTP
ncbi:MAG: DNA replication/repair protein RecF [Roseinatronobacter sp.]